MPDPIAPSIRRYIGRIRESEDGDNNLPGAAMSLLKEITSSIWIASLSDLAVLAVLGFFIGAVLVIGGI